MTSNAAMCRLLSAGVSRRDLMKMFGATAGGAAVASIAIKPVDAAFQSVDDRPEIIVGVQAIPGTLDPMQHISNVGNRVWWSIYDHLIEPDFAGGDPAGTGGALLPMVATAWTRVDDLTLELTLRDDVLFHNGDTLTAEDVKFSIERMMADDGPAELVNTKPYVSAFASVEAVDPTTVRITTTAPDPVLEARLGAVPFWLMPKAYFEEVGLETFNAAPVGTGPYKVVELRTDDALVLEAHDGYFGGLPPVKRLTFQVIPEVATRVTSVATGETQIITNVPPDQIPTLESDDNVKVLQIPLANCHVLVYNTKHSVLSDKLLRQALNLGIDRQLLIDTLWSGNAMLMRGHQIEAWGPLYNAERPFLQYDPEQARALVEQSAYNGEEITYAVHPTYYTLGLEAAQAIAPMWEAIGVKIKLDVREDAFETPVEEVMIRQWSNGMFPFDPDGTFWRNYGEATMPQRNYWTPENPRFNELGNAARRTLDQQFRYDAYQELLDIWEDEAPTTILYQPMETYATVAGVNWLPYTFWYMDFRADNLSAE